MEALHLVAVAFQFLTRLPVRARGFADDDVRRSMAAFPLIGAAVAAIGTGVYWAAGLVWNLTVASVLAVAAMVVSTGAFHEDGLADTADGLWGGHTPQRRLEIMRDSRLGTYGTVALVITLTVRVALLAGLSVADFGRAVLVGHVLGRTSSVFLPRLSRPVGAGTGATVAKGPGPAGSVVAGAMAVVSALAALGAAGAVPLAIGALVTLACAALCNRRLGGINGDALGATNQLVHVSSMAAAVALVGG